MTRFFYRPIFALSTLALVGLAAEPAAAHRITPQGVGAIKLGAQYSTLRAKGLIGPIQRGCELAGPNARSANLLAPLKGSVDFTQTSPRRVATITIRGGASTPRGISVGSTSRALMRAYPRARFDHTTDSVFGATFVRVGRRGGGPLGFTVGVSSKRVQLIAAPHVVACE